MARNARSSGSALVLAAALAAATGAYAGDVSVKLDSGAGFSVKNNTGSIERLRVDEATGNISRNGVRIIQTVGPSNFYVGRNAGNPAGGANGNTGFGDSALAANIFGNSNTAIGRGVLISNTAGAFNAAVGDLALSYNISGYGNTATGAGALRGNVSGTYNTATGRLALRYNGASENTATGAFALTSNTSGPGNTATGVRSLMSNSTGAFNTATGHSALLANTTGSLNTAAGARALISNTTGMSNTAAGSYALAGNTTGYWNSALGESALRNNSSGPQNSAFGKSALSGNTTGSANSAFGSTALQTATASYRNAAFGQAALRFNTTGSDNAAFGRAALYTNTTGSRNVALGSAAGYGQTTGNDNIYLASAGVAGEGGQIKIGTVGTHTGTTIAGISGATSAGGIAVLVNASGKLGTTTSSARFKQDVRDMGVASDVLMKLRPVVFRYREEAVGPEDARIEQYGLIAEEVAEVAPELVAQDTDGKPYSVKYHELPALLVNEVQRQEHTIDAQARLISEQRQVIAALAQRVERLEAR